MGLLLTVGLTGSLCAQHFPSKPVTFVVPYAPGGGADIVARTVGQALSRVLGEQVIIDNRPGAGGNLGAAIVVRAAPDGYTWLLATNTHAVNASLYQKPGYDLVRDFAPVSQLTTTPLVLIVHPSLPVTNVQTLVNLARKRPGDLNYSSGGNGSTPHLAAEIFRAAAQIKITHVPYKGVAQAMNDVVNGQVHLMFPSISAASVHTSSGRLRAIATTGAKRSRAAPDLPTMMESGYREVEVSIWNALLLPARAIADLTGTLHREVARILNDTDLRDRLANLGVEAVSTTPQQLDAYIKAELARWARVVREAGVRID